MQFSSAFSGSASTLETGACLTVLPKEELRCLTRWHRAGSLTLTVILAPVKQDGEPLPPDEYEVWIGPVQEGVTWFFQEGDEVLTLPVRIVR